MSRVSRFRTFCPIRIRELQLLTLEADYLFLLRQNGPLAFLVQEIGRKKPVEGPNQINLLDFALRQSTYATLECRRKIADCVFIFELDCPRLLQMLNLHTPPYITKNAPISNTNYLLNNPIYRAQKTFDRLEAIRLGDPHSCTCREHKLYGDLCLHINWILLRKFKINYLDSHSYQLGMSDQEINDCLTGKIRIHHANNKLPRLDGCLRNSLSKVSKKPIEKTDACPICLDGFFRTERSVTYCVYSCGNAVHINCVWMVAKYFLEEQKQLENPAKDEDGTMLKCPLCRGNFNELSAIESEYKASKLKINACKQKLTPLVCHNISCCYCGVEPLKGNLYKCLSCCQVLVCALCLRSEKFEAFHGKHGYAVKTEQFRLIKKLGCNGCNYEFIRESSRRQKASGNLSKIIKACDIMQNHFHLAFAGGRKKLASPRKTFITRNDENIGKRIHKCHVFDNTKMFKFLYNKYKVENNTQDINSSERLLEILPLIKVTRSFLRRNLLCPGCSNFFHNLENIIGLRCGHYFHYKCLMEHLQDCYGNNSAVCPLDNICIRPPLRKQSATTKYPIGKNKKTAAVKYSGVIPEQLEVRISRMNLSQRPTECNVSSVVDKRKPLHQPQQKDTNDKGIMNKQRKKPNCNRGQYSRKTEAERTLSLQNSMTIGRSLSAQVNPLMTVLMSPSFSEHSIGNGSSDLEKSSAEKTEKYKGKDVYQLNVKLLQLEDEIKKARASEVENKIVNDEHEENSFPRIKSTIQFSRMYFSGGKKSSY